jgi:hypothetical protein
MVPFDKLPEPICPRSIIHANLLSNSQPKIARFYISNLVQAPSTALPHVTTVLTQHPEFTTPTGKKGVLSDLFLGCGEDLLLTSRIHATIRTHRSQSSTCSRHNCPATEPVTSSKISSILAPNPVLAASTPRHQNLNPCRDSTTRYSGFLSTLPHCKTHDASSLGPGSRSRAQASRPPTTTATSLHTH